MKKAMFVVIAVLAISSFMLAQNATGSNAFTAGAWSTSVPGGVTPPTGALATFGIDKLGAHQNGGRGCVGCHAPHSGGRGNGGNVVGTGTASAAGVAEGDEDLWGQDLGPIYSVTLNFPTNPDTNASGDVTLNASSNERLVTGVAMCLSCHDGNVAKGAMMANASWEQSAGLLPASYGTATIPTLLGADGGPAGNYGNDHPVGVNATLGSVGHGAINSSHNFFALAGQGGLITKGAGWTGSTMAEFYKNYGLPLSVDARSGAGWATDASANLDDAYVVCTTCHTPHSMYTTTAKLNGVSKGTVPTYFFIAAPYNPGADVSNGTKASSATQFCRQCHFSGPGGANEASGISIPTAF